MTRNTWFKIAFPVLVCAWSLPGSAHDVAASASAPCEAKTDHAAFVAAYIKAFNAHDVAAMRAMWSADIQWVNITGDKVEVISNGADALARSMTRYFTSVPDVRSDVSDIVIAGNLVSFRETASWGQDAQRKSQQALAIYDVRNGKIHRFWYVSSE